jgi:hypothetical protein
MEASCMICGSTPGALNGPLLRGQQASGTRGRQVAWTGSQMLILDGLGSGDFRVCTPWLDPTANNNAPVHACAYCTDLLQPGYVSLYLWPTASCSATGRVLRLPAH